MRALSGDQLLRLPVRLHGIELGRAVDLVVDETARRAVGIDVLCGDHAHRFLPLGAATLTPHEIRVDSPFAVIDDAAFYLERGHTLRDLRGASVARGGVEEGRLEDVVVGTAGELVELVLADGNGGRRVEFTPELTVGPPTARRSAA